MLAVNKSPAPILVTNTNPHIIQNKEIAIDVSLLYSVSGNDESFIRMMVLTFLKTMPETIKKIEESLKKQDWENVYRSAHFAKSSLSVIKVAEMLDWVVQVEVNAKNEIDLELLPGLLEKIKQKFAAAEEFLSERFNEQS